MSYHYEYNRTLIPFSQTNRRNQTNAEKLLWFRLRNRQLKGYKFRRQYPIYNYILDFYCSEKQFAIELDGSQHIKSKSYDQKRLEQLQALGIRIARFWDNDVLQNIDGVLKQILIALNRTSDEKPHPNPLLKGEGKYTSLSSIEGKPEVFRDVDGRFKDQFVRVKNWWQQMNKIKDFSVNLAQTWFE